MSGYTLRYAALCFGAGFISTSGIGMAIHGHWLTGIAFVLLGVCCWRLRTV